MQKHANTLVLEKFYADWSSGDFTESLASCPEGITFQVPGKSPLAGKYSKTTFTSELVVRLRELSGGSFQLEAHDILASDRHAAVMVTERLMRDGKVVETRAVHIWRFEAGSPVAWYLYPRDLYQFDSLWG